jgi:(E)-4-hydroxy-3-methylbut-2-enyl-diphosphate synthase
MDEFLTAEDKSDKANFILCTIEDLNDPSVLRAISGDSTGVLILRTNNKHAMAELRRMFIELMNNSLDIPVIISREYTTQDEEKVMLYSSTEVGGLLIDGLGNGIWIEPDSVPIAKINSISFGILQATRTRISRTEYISCPSCGRTEFDLQETTARIRSRTQHLKGVKIAVMGCIVNGPGEMADADFGYVGSGPGKITLYKGKDVVQRGIDSEIAVDKLIELIKENGMWTEPS